MAVGFLCAFAGDWFLAIQGSPRNSAGFLCGVVCFSLAHLFWMSAQLRETRPRLSACGALAIPLAVFAGVRLAPCLPTGTAAAVGVYSVISAVSLATAVATRRVCYLWGIGLLVLSDLCMGGRWLGAPGCGALAGPVYIAAELCLLVSLFWRGERRIDVLRHPAASVVTWGASAALCFLTAMAVFPGGGYRPWMRMLSALGRVANRMVGFPLSHFLFMAGMACAATAISYAAVFLESRHVPVPESTGAHRPKVPESTGAHRPPVRIGLMLNVAGLLVIALVPEDVGALVHNAGCWLAAGGGVLALIARDRPGPDRLWSIALGAIAALFGGVTALHALKIIPFAPAVPSLQKVLILAFAGWILWLMRPWEEVRAWRRMKGAGVVLALAAGLLVWKEVPVRPVVPPVVAERPAVASRPLNADERAALAWLDHVTGPLPSAEEKDWWDIGGTQHGLFGKRYGIAFAGYAAATLGFRGDAEQRRTVGRILKNCLDRILRKDVWAYAMSRNYWGRKPWAPDPCYRENVMYTGHLLQLLALYELFTGDRTYWEKGWDFVWDDKTRVHYDVKRLIDVTVLQMRKGPNGGVACEPGLVFFPCNNHPHVALRLFSKLGHGDWTRDARRWEDWALAHYRHPLLGGGVLNLVYHARSGIFYPYGHPGLDGWSLLWYEAWASNRGTAVALWREAAARIDWSLFDRPTDTVRGRMCCSDPSDVPATASAAFLAAAARACGDDATAERLERALDVYLVRRDGRCFLDLGRAWRIGATAMRIMALAEKNGSSWRRELER